MKIALIGDVHGRVYHALAAVLALQARIGAALDLVIQVGDLGAFPDRSRLDEATQRWARRDPSELHFSHLLGASGEFADALRAAREQLSGPVLFIRGNHEDMEWLAGLAPEADRVAVDPFDLFQYVRDGTMIDLDGYRVALLGGCQYGAEPATAIDRESLARLGALAPGSVDLLVTHDGPHAVATNYEGATQGSTMLSELIARLQPAHHVGGHYHHMIGPRTYGETTYIGLAALFPGRRGGPPLQDGCLALLDTERAGVEFVTGDWLRELGAGLDVERYFAAL